MDRLPGYVDEKYRETVKKIISEMNSGTGSLAPGVYDYGPGIVVKRVSVLTAEESSATIETHRWHIDIQMPLDRTELYNIYRPDESRIVSDDREKDFVFYERPLKLKASVRVCPGEFILIEPMELHQPQIADGRPERIEKLVIKLDIDEK